MQKFVGLLFCAAVLVGVMWSQAEGSHWQSPKESAAKRNPLAAKPELAAGGQKMFSRNCAQCHAAGANQKGPKLDSSSVQSQTDGELFWKISNGNARTGMPSFSSLPEAQRWQLVLYLRELNKQAHGN